MSELSDLFPDIEFGDEVIESTAVEVYRSVHIDEKTVVLDPKEHTNEVVTKGNEYLDALTNEQGLKDALDVFDNRKKELQKQIDELKKSIQDQITAMTTELYDIDVASRDLRRTYREAQKVVDGLLRQFRQALDNELASQRMIEAGKAFDEKTQNFKWRQFAFPHQIEGAKYLAANGRVILGDKMGLGKSMTSLIACDMMESKKVLIIVPDDVVSNFIHEVVKWAPHRQVWGLGKLTKAERAATFELMNFMQAYVCVINYSAWRRDSNLLDQLLDRRFDTIIIDEAHTIKETSTNAYKGVKKVVLSENACPECAGPIMFIENRIRQQLTHKSKFWECKNTEGCGWSENRDIDEFIKRPAYSLNSAKHVFPMTGTAILNKPTDLFALLSLIDPVNFSEKYKFEFDYCARDIYTNKIVFRSGGMASLVKRLSGKWLARDRHQAGIVLPKQEVVTHTLQITAEEYPLQMKVIQQLTKYATIMLESGKQLSAIAAIALITRKRQANVYPAGIQLKDPFTGDVVFNVGDEVKESIKLDWCCTEDGEGNIMDMTADGNMTLDEQGEMVGDRVVVFSQFKGPLADLEDRLRKNGVSVVRYDGDTPEHLKVDIKKDFDRSRCHEDGYTPKWQVVLCNYRTGGQGLNFTDCTQMVILDSEWNGGKEDQAFGRVDRMGQTEETTVHILEIENSIDDWMRGIINDKRNLVDGFESTAAMSQAIYEAMISGKML